LLAQTTEKRTCQSKPPNYLFEDIRGAGLPPGWPVDLQSRAFHLPEKTGDPTDNPNAPVEGQTIRRRA